MILEYFGVVIGSIALEFIANPAGFLGSLVFGLGVAACCMWGCWRVGRLFHLAHRPGAGVFVLAVLAGLSGLSAVVALSAVSYTRSFISDAFQVSQVGAQTLSNHGSGACKAVRSALPYLSRQTGYTLSLDCDSPGALEGLRNQLGPKAVDIHMRLQDRLRWNQFVTVMAALMSMGILFAIPSWRACRGFTVHVGSSAVRGYPS